MDKGLSYNTSDCLIIMALTQEIDMAILTKSLKLLHSPDDDSAEQLRVILEETIKSKYGNRKPINLTGLGLSKKSITVSYKCQFRSRLLKYIYTKYIYLDLLYVLFLLWFNHFSYD